MEKGLRMPVSGLLADKGIRDVDTGFHAGEKCPELFHKGYEDMPGEQTRPDSGFDVFSAVFYMLSRYEEYLPFEADRHGRYDAGNSLAGRKGFVDIPVVDLWVRDLERILKGRYPGLKTEEPAFRFIPTSDIDLPYAILHRGKLRTLAAGIKAGIRGNDDREFRKKVLEGKRADPFDTYAEIEEIHARAGTRPIVFFLTSGYGKFDKSISPGSKPFRDLVKHTGRFADLGIHPSYRAAGRKSILEKEIAALARISGQAVTRSRQHYLKFNLPRSYRNYMDAGIREEYSMGFASAAGFRSGTARPFYFYDLEREEATTLKIIPFMVMDRTLKDYMGLTPGQALDKILDIAGKVKNTGGNFCVIWHNDAFSDYGEWKGWKDVYLQMTETMASW
jgi:hypothetical protein